MKVFVAHFIVMGILKKNSLEQYWSRDSILNVTNTIMYLPGYTGGVTRCLSGPC